MSFIKVYISSEMPCNANFSEKIITLQCERFICFPKYPLTKFIALLKEEAVTVFIKVEAFSDEPDSETREGEEN